MCYVNGTDELEKIGTPNLKDRYQPSVPPLPPLKKFSPGNLKQSIKAKAVMHRRIEPRGYVKGETLYVLSELLSC